MCVYIYIFIEKSNLCCELLLSVVSSYRNISVYHRRMYIFIFVETSEENKINKNNKLQYGSRIDVSAKTLRQLKRSLRSENRLLLKPLVAGRTSIDL